MVNTVKYDMVDPETFANGPPHDIFDDLRQRSPIYGQPHPYFGTVWSLTKYEDVREATKNTQVFSSMPFISYTTRPDELKDQTANSIMYLDPPEHTRLRNFAAKAFLPSVVARFEDWIREICIEIADRVSAIEGEFDAVKEVSSALPAKVICSIMGVPPEDRERVITLVTNQVREFEPEIGLEGAGRAIADLQAYCLKLRALKIREPGVDMTTQLAKSEGADSLSDEEFTSLVWTLASAGYETTQATIAHSLWQISLDAKIRAAFTTTDRRTLSPAVDELLRLVTPAMYFGRTVSRDVEFHGAKMAKGNFVMMWYSAANHDPARFDKPHEFIVERSSRNHFAFGAGGPHTCIGMHLAKLEMELLHQEFSKRDLKLELVREPRRISGVFLNGLRDLPMRVMR